MRDIVSNRSRPFLLFATILVTMQIPERSPLWLAHPNHPNFSDYLLGISEGDLMNDIERDAIVDLIWSAVGTEAEEVVPSSLVSDVCVAVQKVATLLHGKHHALAIDTLRRVLNMEKVGPKQWTLGALGPLPEQRDLLVQTAATASSWPLRREAIETMQRFSMGDIVAQTRCAIQFADDPHWRVRLSVVDWLKDIASHFGWLSTLENARQAAISLAPSKTTSSIRRMQGVWNQLCFESGISEFPPLDFLLSNASQAEATPLDHTWETPTRTWMIDPDPLVVAWNLKQERSHVDNELDRWSVRWLGHEAPEVAEEARRRLLLVTEEAHLIATVDWLNDPRTPGCAQFLNLVRQLDGDRIERLVRYGISSQSERIRTWSKQTSDTVLSDESAQSQDQREYVDLVPSDVLRGDFSQWLSDPRVEVRMGIANRIIQSHNSDGVDPAMLARCQNGLSQLQRDIHPQVRRAAVDENRALTLCSSPEQETSWSVLRKAVQFRNESIPVSFSREEPQIGRKQLARVDFGDVPFPRLVIPGRPLVAPMGLSGHYHPPEEAFLYAAQSGVQMLFYEPNYSSMRRFLNGIPEDDRHRFRIVTGTFEAEPKRIQHDVERALKWLKRSYVDLFLLFWVRDWSRISPPAIAILEKLKAQGKVLNYSLSTHNLNLAEQAIQSGWAPLMVRHNAAHRHAEKTILPLAEKQNTPVILFNNTCYGRLLRPTALGVSLTAADCYRFSLEQPGARACWTAPATMEQLRANLDVLSEIRLSDETRSALLERGASVRASDKEVEKNLRWIS
jgi:hypothetical protein